MAETVVSGALVEPLTNVSNDLNTSVHQQYYIKIQGYVINAKQIYVNYIKDWSVNFALAFII